MALFRKKGEKEYRKAVFYEQSGKEEAAIPLFKKAAYAGYPPAMIRTGQLLEAEDEWEKAIDFYQDAVNAAEDEADEDKYLTYYDSLKRQLTDESDVLDQLPEKGPDQLIAFAQSLIDNGHEKRGVRLLEKAGEQGISRALNLLYLRFSGNGGRDTDRALYYLRKSISLGDSDAYILMGNNYHAGHNGFPVNDQLAFSWYKKAAEKENPTGLYRLADCYASGRGIAPDTEKALQLYEKSASLGYNNAMRYLTAYYDMHGEFKKAAFWTKKAADNGQPDAQLKYGIFLSCGKGVKKNITEASRYLTLAQRNGSLVAKEALDRLNKRPADYPFHDKDIIHLSDVFSSALFTQGCSFTHYAANDPAIAENAVIFIENLTFAQRLTIFREYEESTWLASALSREKIASVTRNDADLFNLDASDETGNEWMDLHSRKKPLENGDLLSARTALVSQLQLKYLRGR